MVSQSTKTTVRLDGAPRPLSKVIFRQTLRPLLSVDEGWLTLALKRGRQQPSARPTIAGIAAGVTCATEARRPGMFTTELYHGWKRRFDSIFAMAAFSSPL